jgi:hypothetical protein
MSLVELLYCIYLENQLFEKEAGFWADEEKGQLTCGQNAFLLYVGWMFLVELVTTKNICEML